ncbi:gliding motility-associated C-terminal domain-containing protein [Aureispira sp. CCB-E]|uniref:T9SS type B sorting domain-containing protein n=1 Tax=Aureispira sp. CCB-E TaxID=3051121 RepID=UPI002868CBBD|nr:gliding motility-associated C-terminal domain-containing protein [Aureispira sp. CCB-E]WMX16423.1 gliding motility-associated C-terminal domain-containing protein [Aureispira sp. CCB-E]
MKQIYQLFLLFVLLLGSSNIVAQSDSCYNATPFCDSVNQYAATVNGPTAPTGNNYGCLVTQPNPTFFTLTVSQSGTIDITLQNTAGVDIDYILWGPYPDAATAQSFCGNLGHGTIANGNVVDTCSYSAVATEFVQVSNAVAGSVYILMITNFSNQPTNIFSTSNAGTGSIGCPCNLGYNIDTLNYPINNGFLTDTSVVYGQYVVCPNDQLGIQIGVSGNPTDTLRIYQPFTTINSVFPGASLFTASGLNHDTISIGAVFTPDRSHIGTQQFDIAVQSTTPTNTCQEIVTIEVIVPGIDLRDTTICSGDSIKIPIDTFPVTYVGFSQYKWTQIGGIPATISDDTLAQPSISAPPLPAGVAYDSIVLEVDFSYGGCVTVDTVTIIVIGIPNAEFTYPNTVYCQQGPSNPTGVITGTPGGTFSSNTGVVFVNTQTGEIDLANTPVGNHNIFYELSSPGGQCDARDTFNLSIIGITTFEATASEYFICDNELDTVQLNLNVVYGGTAPSSPTYSWTPTSNLNNPNIQNPLAFLIEPDTFVVSYDDGVCAVQTDTVSISSPYPANITVSPDATICNGATIQLGASVAASSGNQNFCIPASTTIVTENTTLVTLNVSGVAPSVINSALIASLSTQLGINMNAIGHLTIDLIAPSGEVVTLSNRNGGLNTAFPSSTFSSAAGNAAITSIPFFGGIPAGSYYPQAGASGFNTLIGATTNGTWTLRIVHNNSGLGTTNGTLTDWCLTFQDLSQATFSWSPNYNISCVACDSPFVNPTVDTAYMAIAQNAFGCRDTGIVNITIDSALPAPILTCGNITSTTVTFNWALIPGAAGYSVSVNGNTPNIVGATVDSFQVTGLTPSQCAQITVFALSGTSCQDGDPDSLTCCAVGCTSIDPITIGTSGPTTFCFGQSVTLDAGAGYSSYQWSTAVNDTNQTVTVTTTQLVSVTTTDALGCLDTGSVQITVTPGPTPTIVPSGSTTLCAGDTVFLDAGSFANYAWSPSGNTQVIPATTSAVHVVTVTDAQGCIGFDSIIVNVGAPLLTPITKTDLSCNGTVPGDGTATVAPSGGFTPYSYNWSTGANTATISNLVAGTYIVTVTDNNNCVAIDSIVINEPTPVVATTTGTPVSCNGSSDGIARAFGSGGTPGYNFLWDANTGNQTTAFATGLLPGTYCVTVTDANGCTDTACTVILQTTQTFSAGGDTTICEGDTTQLTATLADGYTWTPAGSLNNANAQNPLAFPTTTTTYYVTADILSGVNIIYNGDFEDGDVGFSSAYTVGTGGPFGQLSNAGTYAINTNSSNTHNNFSSCTDHTSSSGNFMIVNGSTVANQSVWCQTVNVTPNTDYQFSTWVTSVEATNPASLQFSINGVNVGNPFSASSTTCQWNQFFATWNSGTNTTATICIVNQNIGNGGNDFGLDDIEFVPICNMVDSVVVTVNPKPTITINNNTPICENDTINLTSNGGVAYNWSGPNAFTSAQQNPTLLNAVAANSGQYIVTVTTALGCSDTASTNVIVNQHPSVTISNTPVLCFGTSTGTATANVTGGGGGYTYTWSNTQTVNPITNLPIGSYQVTVIDANGCFDSASTTISEPSQVTATISTTAVSCHGGTDGTATATVGGGTPGVPAYTYDWGTGATASATSSGQAAGVHTVTISDANGCSITESYTITEPSAISFTVSSTSASCNGASDGSATINASGGVGGFSYAWNSSAQTTATATGLPAGLHCVTVTDGNGCTVDTCIQVNEPAGFSNINFSTINVSCFGGSNGQATISLTGGVGAYTYNWSNGDNTATATGLDANTHSVTVTDANGCTVTANVIITEPTALQLGFDVDSVQCKNGNDGSVTALVTGGTFPYSYQWDPSTGSGGQVTATASNLTVGTYTVTVTDFNGCTILGSATVFEPSTVLTAAIINQLNPSCHGSCDGSIEVDAQGATPNYTYQWSNGQNTSIATNVCAGAHTVTVTDANGCSVSTGSVLTEPTAITLNPQVLSNYNGAAISCTGAADGSVGVVVAGGSGGYSYVWSPQGQNTANINGLVAGTYCVTVTDVAGCQMDTCITIADPVQLAATYTAVDVLCHGDANGQILVNATPGTGTLGVNGYEYKITGPGQTGNVFSNINTYNNLGAGSYTVFVRDGNNCEIALPISIGEPDSVLIDSVIVTDVSCHGTATGSATAYPSGGVGNYTYTWSTTPVQTTATATGLAAGVYSVTVADANGCDRVEVFNVNEPTVLTGSISADPIDCFGGTTSATAQGSGGTPIGLTAYVYRWSNGSSAATTIGLSAGVHCVTITDANACTHVECVTITQPSTAVSASISAQTDASCNGTATGTATAQGTGGTSPYTYQWDAAAGNQTTATATGLSAGIYTVVVSDTNNCTAQTTVTISEPSVVLATISSTTPATCNGQGTGSATATVSGGVGPYTYQWDAAAGSQTTATASNLAGGTYVVTVSDANGCTGMATAIVTQPTAVQATIINTTDVSCHGGNDGTASLAVQGGTPTSGYTFQWSGAPGQNSPNATGLSAGVQTVTVSDANGCFDIDTFTINEPNDALSGYITAANALCFGSSTGELGAVITGGTRPYQYAWNSTPVQTTVVADSLPAGTYNLSVTDANGCSLELTSTIGEPTELTVSATVLQHVSCFGGSNGAVAVNATSGGVGPYTYVWTDPSGQVGLNASNLSAGAISVIVTDANACTAMATVTLTEGTPITVTETVSNISCHGLTDGSINITGSNKVLVNYSWSNGMVSNPVTGLGAGNYTVTVTDADGCQETFNYTITEPAPISLSIASTNSILCYGDGNAAAQVTATGGTSPYNYNWSNGATTRTASNLTPGTYDVTVTDSRGCFETTSISIVEPEELTITGNTTGTLCAGDQTGTLTAFGSGGTVTVGLLEYSIDGSTWQNGNIFSGLASGIYTLSVRDENGCVADTMLVVEDADPFFITSMTGDTTIEYLDSLTIAASLNDTVGVTYSWQQISGAMGLVTDSSFSFGIRPQDAVQYQFTATNSNGCSVDSIVMIEVTKLRRANAPTGFTPNGDGVNDYFFIQGGSKVQTVTIFRVYDRWGTLVFEGNNSEINVPEQGWNGIYRGRPAPSGTYTWYADVLFKDGHTEQVKGNITLLR